jgi:hypothetical protein
VEGFTNFLGLKEIQNPHAFSSQMLRLLLVQSIHVMRDVRLLHGWFSDAGREVGLQLK